MTEESPDGIRPIWLIGGAAATVTLGLCALISIIALGIVLWLSTSRTNGEADPTQIAVAPETQPAFTDTPLAVAVPSPLPGIGTQPPAPVATFITPSVAPALAPDQAVRTYFQLVTQRRYDLTWQMLSDAFKQKFNCCAPNYNYTDYVSWWNSVSNVEFGQVNTVSQSGDRAVVYAELYYVMSTGDRSGADSTSYIELVHDAAYGGWRFVDKRANP